jgi:uncharacterized protein
MLKKIILSVVSCFVGHAYALLTPLTDSIPMKDGRKLAVDIYIPSGMGTGPTILVQTPYNRLLYRLGLPLGIGNDINSSNYIMVIVDWRGFYGSKKAGYFGSPDRGTDGYWVVEWIASQTWSNGKVGTWGPSALGKVQYQTAQKNPPHLTCICPLVAGPQFNYDEYFPNGALRTEYVQQLDGLGFGLSSTLMAHPYYDATWSIAESLNFYPDSIRVPSFMIGGWYDHNIEVMLSFFAALQTKSPLNVRDKHKLLMGPWVHGGHGTAQVGTSLQGQLNYPNSADVNDSMALEFFDFHLRTINNGWDQKPKVTYYQMGENVWQNSPSWPPANSRDVRFYLHSSGVMDHVKPSVTRDSLSFTYDPQDPSPTIGGPTLSSELDQGPYDQKTSVESRNDILKFTTDVLATDVVLKGSVKISLKVSSDRVDTDFAVRLTDVYPDGRSMLVNDGIMRMRFRNGFSQAQVGMMVPGNVYDCEIDMDNTSITFLAGHKIRLDVSSSNYPRYNRNMNNGANMYPGNSLDSLLNPLVAINTVHLGAANTSSISMPLQGYTNSIMAYHVHTSPLLLYPNPAIDNIELEGGITGKYDIHDAKGTLVMQGEMMETSQINISALASGIYNIRLEDPLGIRAGRFIKY